MNHKDCQDLDKVVANLLNEDRTKNCIYHRFETMIFNHALKEFHGDQNTATSIVNDSYFLFLDRVLFCVTIDKEMTQKKTSSNGYLNNIGVIINKLNTLKSEVKLFKAENIFNEFLQNNIIGLINDIYNTLTKSETLVDSNLNYLYYKKGPKLFKRISDLYERKKKLTLINKKNWQETFSLLTKLEEDIEKIEKSLSLYTLINEFNWNACKLYLMSIVKRIVQDYRRTHKKDNNQALEPEDSHYISIGTSINVPYEKVFSLATTDLNENAEEVINSRKQRYKKAFSKLSKKCQQILNLYGTPHDEISKKLKISNSTSRKRLSDCKKRITVLIERA